MIIFQCNCGSNNIDTKPCAAPLKRFTITLGSVRFYFFKLFENVTL